MAPAKNPGDVNAPKVSKLMLKIHQAYPSIPIGQILQQAVDNRKKQENFNLHDLSSKEMLIALTEYKELLDEKKKNR